jgi:hypothetical protein
LFNSFALPNLLLYFLLTLKESNKEKALEMISSACFYARYAKPYWRYKTG